MRAIDMLQRYVRKTQTIVVSQRDIQVVYQHHVRVLYTHTDTDYCCQSEGHSGSVPEPRQGSKHTGTVEYPDNLYLFRN